MPLSLGMACTLLKRTAGGDHARAAPRDIGPGQRQPSLGPALEAAAGADRREQAGQADEELPLQGVADDDEAPPLEDLSKALCAPLWQPAAIRLKHLAQAHGVRNARQTNTPSHMLRATV
jgi:hypothetical protein